MGHWGLESLLFLHKKVAESRLELLQAESRVWGSNQVVSRSSICPGLAGEHFPDFFAQYIWFPKVTDGHFCDKK